MNFGDKLKQIRANQGLSQEQLAEKIGVSRQAITKWETNRGLPDVENMIILAEIFKVTLDELVLQRPIEEETSETVYESQWTSRYVATRFEAQLRYLASGQRRRHQKCSGDFGTVPVRPAAFSSSFRSREERPMSQRPSWAALMPEPEPVGL